MPQSEEIKILKQELKKANDQILSLEKAISFTESAPGISHEINNNINLVTGYIQVLDIRIKGFSKLINEHKNLAENTYSLYKKCSDIKTLELKLVESGEDLNHNQNLQQHKLDLFKSLEEQIDVFYNENKSIGDLDEIIELEEVKEELLEASSAIRLAFNRIHEISYDLSLLGKNTPSEPIKINVNESIEHTLLVIKKKLGKKIKIHKMLGDVPEINSYRGKLNQVFTNLIKNALEAIEDKDKITKEDYIQIETRQEGDYVLIKISDSGAGMRNETKHKLFKEFYTTKGERGTGLGMGVCRSIVEKHKGNITFASELGKGTEFVILLPI